MPRVHTSTASMVLCISYSLVDENQSVHRRCKVAVASVPWYLCCCGDRVIIVHVCHKPNQIIEKLAILTATCILLCPLHSIRRLQVAQMLLNVIVNWDTTQELPEMKTILGTSMTVDGNFEQLRPLTESMINLLILRFDNWSKCSVNSSGHFNVAY